MALYSITPPLWLKWLYGRGFLWDIKTNQRQVYLTFDDGPIPGITDWVLSQLEEYGFKATFFCIGSNVHKHPQVYQNVLKAGHAVGNHTFNHINGFNVTLKEYSTNINNCAQVVDSKLFRPPYGKINYRQRQWVLKGYKPVMWSVLSADFDTTISPEQCLHNAIKHTQPGSIVLFHDSVKAEKNLRYTLPRYLAWLKQEGYTSAAINI